MAPQHRPGRTGPGREPGVPAVAALEDYGRPSETSTKAEALERARVKTSEVSRSRPPKAKEEERRRPVTSSQPARTPSPSKFAEGASPVGEVGVGRKVGARRRVSAAPARPWATKT